MIKLTNLSAVGLMILTSVTCYAEPKTVVVSADGKGDFKTVQEAIAAVPENNADRTIVQIKPGQYTGPVVIPKTKPHITLLGENAETTVISWAHNVYDPAPEGSNSMNPGLLVNGDDFQAVGVTIENTAGDHGQALAVMVNSDRCLFLSCRLLGWQDTLMINGGRDYFRDCYIAGRVDFIYGSATAWFQDCEIHSRNGGHVTAASTPEDHEFGFVFDHCKLTGDKTAWDPATTNPSTTVKPKVTPKADLGRPWRAYASVTYLQCDMGDHITPEGWNNWRKESNEKTARYSEYKSTGPGGASDKRVAWSHQLTDEQAAAITVTRVLGGNDQWDPVAALNAPPKVEAAKLSK